MTSVLVEFKQDFTKIEHTIRSAAVVWMHHREAW